MYLRFVGGEGKREITVVVQPSQSELLVVQEQETPQNEG